MSFLGGGFRMFSQPFRPFIAGTKVTKYIAMKNQLAEKEKEEQTRHNCTMIKDGVALSPPHTPLPVDLCAQAKLTSPSITKFTDGEKMRSPTSPGFTFDGFTFTTDVSEFFSIDSPTSPPDSEYDVTEVSVASDDALVPERKRLGGSTSSTGSYISAELAEAAIQAVQSEPGLGPAITSVLKTGSMMPLVKEELRCTIQTKRLAKGKGELDVAVTSKPANEKLSPEEKNRRVRRRERNKLAAQKCRDKKMEMAKQLTEETEMLETANDSLRTEVKSLEAELESLKFMLLRHDKSTQCGTNLSSTNTPRRTKTATSPNKAARPSKRQRTK